MCQQYPQVPTDSPRVVQKKKYVAMKINQSDLERLSKQNQKAERSIG